MKLENTYEFLNSILDSVSENIAVIDGTGVIQYVNKKWMQFGDDNECSDMKHELHSNYLEVCDKAALMGDEFASIASHGIRSVIFDNKTQFYLEYPCHSPERKQWFMMRVTPFYVSQISYFVITHQDITERKLAEETVSNLALLDGLTNIPNRRAFDNFLTKEWSRCARTNNSICLAILDIDYFKNLNDSYGHQYGDTCLKKIGQLLKLFAKRPSDICARYGGEEFAIVLGDTNLKQAFILLEKLLKQIEALKIPHKNSVTSQFLTASIGLAEMIADKATNETELIKKSDTMLYKAKASGRNTIKY
jgi:diguanylate cyclase (GGDEF)-like protein